MNPVTRRRLHQFRAHRRGYWSLWIFTVLFGTSLCAEFIANDRPILMKHAGEYWLPTFGDYTEIDLGGELPILAQYKDPYVIDLVERSVQCTLGSHDLLPGGDRHDDHRQMRHRQTDLDHPHRLGYLERSARLVSVTLDDGAVVITGAPGHPIMELVSQFQERRRCVFLFG